MKSSQSNLSEGSSNILARLSPEDALEVLRILAKDDRLAAQIEQVARAFLEGNAPHTSSDVEELAETVQWELEDLNVEDVWAQAGPTRDGYIETNEVAYRMVVAVIQPYRDDLTRYQQLTMTREAKSICMAVLEGLYKFDHESETPFKDWALDALFAEAQRCLALWLTGKPAAKQHQQMRKFVEERLPLWAVMLLSEL